MKIKQEHIDLVGKISVSEIAKLAGCTRAWIYAYLKLHKIPLVKVKKIPDIPVFLLGNVSQKNLASACHVSTQSLAKFRKEIGVKKYSYNRGKKYASAIKNKEAIIFAAKQGIKRVDLEKKLYNALAVYCSTTSNAYDGNFAEGICTLRPDWFPRILKKS